MNQPNALKTIPEREPEPGLVRVGTVVEQVRPIARAILEDREPTDVGIRDLRGHARPTHPGDPAEVYYVHATVGDQEIEFVWKRAVEGDCRERLAIERDVYKLIDGRTSRVPALYAEMSDSESGGGIAIEYLQRLAIDTYVAGVPSAIEVGRVAAALAEFARDVPATGKVGSYHGRVMARLREVGRRSALWKFIVDFFEREGPRLDQLETVMSPGFSTPNIGFRGTDPQPVFFDLDTVCPRPIGSGLITGLAMRQDFADLVPIVRASLPQLTIEDIHLLALGRILELWGEGDPGGRPAACGCLDVLGVEIAEEIRSS